MSPGFRVRPGGEGIEARGGAILRTVRSADLFEISAVTVPAYSEAQIEARDWQAPKDAPQDWARFYAAFNRWRA
nr:HK97 family phage prohead protease [Pseudorhodobacter aquimaris]